MYLHIYMDMLEQGGVTNPRYKYFTHKNTKITCNTKCSYLGTSELLEAFKLASQQAWVHQNTSSMLDHTDFITHQCLSLDFCACAVFTHQHQQTPEQQNLIWLHEVIFVISIEAIRLNWSCKITCSGANSAFQGCMFLPEMLQLILY